MTGLRLIPRPCSGGGLFLLLAVLAAGPRSVRAEEFPLGATPYATPAGTGVVFRVWAPGATSVHLAGTFNDWNTSTQPMTPEATGGVWTLNVPGAGIGDRYKYVLNGSLWRTDPRARGYGPSSNNSSVVLGTPAPPAPFTRPPANELVIYELHIGTFYDPNPEDGLAATFTDAIAGLDHLTNLGINAVCVMPCSEFFSARSWGYNPAGHFAIERDYGGREAFEAFIAACHARGIAVLVDIVHNHWGTPVGDLWQFDGTSAGTNTGGIYFYEDERADGRWGPRPNFDTPEVRRFILDSVSEWLELGCDGFRWDAVNYIVRIDGDGTFIPAAATLLQEASTRVRAAGGLNIAENAAVQVPGAFDAQWAISFRSALAGALSASNPAERAVALASALQAIGTDSVVFVESHDTAGKHSSSTSIRWPLKVAGADRTLAMTGVALAWLTGGIPMLFQGQETFQTNVWHDNRPLDWNLGPAEQQCLAFHRDMIRLRRNLDGIGSALMTTSIVATAVDGFIVVKRGGRSNNGMVAVANLHDLPRELPLTLPATGPWYRVLCTADIRYGNPGGGTVALVAGVDPLPISVPAYATLLLAQHFAPDGDMDSDGLPNAWEALHFDHPTAADPDQDSDGDGTSNWHEWLADTRPRDDTSWFHIVDAFPRPDGIVLHFSTSSNRVYDIYRAEESGGHLSPLALDLPGEPPVNTYTAAVPGTICGFFQIRAKAAP